MLKYVTFRKETNDTFYDTEALEGKIEVKISKYKILFGFCSPEDFSSEKISKEIMRDECSVNI